MKNTTVLKVCLLLMVSSLYAQQQVINIWPNGAPGAIENADYKLHTDTSGNHSRTSKVTQPTLSFYPAANATNNTPAVVICPGGGYIVLADGHEGVDIAKWFNSMGVSAFVLRYRLPSDLIMTDKSVGPLQDVQQAIRLVRCNAKKWTIDPTKIGVMGFSAGGHLASTASTHFDEKVYEAEDSTSARPDFSILIYPVVTMQSNYTHKGSKNRLLGTSANDALKARFSNELQVNNNTPPAFLVHSIDDRVVPVQNSINYALAMRKHKRPCELHIYQDGGHGYGLGRNTGTKMGWPEACKLWLKQSGVLQE